MTSSVIGQRCSCGLPSSLLGAVAPIAKGTLMSSPKIGRKWYMFILSLLFRVIRITIVLGIVTLTISDNKLKNSKMKKTQT